MLYYIYYNIGYPIPVHGLNTKSQTRGPYFHANLGQSDRISDNKLDIR